MTDFIQVAYAATDTVGADGGTGGVILAITLAIVMIAWYVIYVVQMFLGYGTAYRKTKTGGDNGTSLFGWCLLYCSLASLVPGLGIYLWKKSKEPMR